MENFLSVRKVGIRLPLKTRFITNMLRNYQKKYFEKYGEVLEEYKVEVRWYLDYCAKPETQEKCRKNAINRSKQLYTHTGSSKSFARWREEDFLDYLYVYVFLNCVEYDNGINVVVTVETTRKESR
ncbi:hypothetical protein Ahy_B08g092234 isoform A [Arachis hypogaea]|uniref:Uncharacterized protein n=1 Tax=Arachis hypogaea TaxID=3818 RepID=A0A444Y3P1_ARAHY|nr:hypothetical protein Ahy_B08g092234 isoform A [Arachis hypogaea]